MTLFLIIHILQITPTQTGIMLKYLLEFYLENGSLASIFSLGHSENAKILSTTLSVVC